MSNMMSRALTLIVAFCLATLTAYAEPGYVKYTGAGAYTNNSVVYYLGTTNAAAATTVNLALLSTTFTVPEKVSYVDIHWEHVTSGAAGTNVFYWDVGYIDPTTNTVTFDVSTNALSAISLTSSWTSLGVTTNRVSQQFSVQGRKYLRPGAIVTTTGSGTTTNHAAIIGYRYDTK